MRKRRIMPDERLMLESQYAEEILLGFDRAVNETMTWLHTPQAKEFFFRQRDQINTFFRESGIEERWDKIIEDRAMRGVDVTTSIFDYARKVNMENHLVPYTDTERRALNRLCDYNYELIRNVTSDEITAIRRKLVQDYGEGTYPLRTHLKELQLEPINGFSPEARAEMIARTESARTLNVSTLETYRNDGVTMVELFGCDPDCKECAEYAKPTPIADAMECELPHPNCTGAWVPVSDNDAGVQPL